MRLLVAFTAVLWSATASAEPFFVDRIPNSRNPELGLSRPCAICHEDPAGGGARNLFGQHFDLHREWSLIYHFDSDGDGQTNGLELGDPDGVWTFAGTPARTSDISLPGDPNDVSFDGPPDAGVVDQGALDTGAPDDFGPAPDGDVEAGVASDDGSQPDAPTSDVGALDAGRELDADLADAGLVPSAPQYPEVICTCARLPSARAPLGGALVGLFGLAALRRRLRTAG